MTRPTPRFTKRQAAILGAFTGYTAGPFSDVHEYVDSLPGFKGIMTIGLAACAEQIREAARADFLELVHNGGDLTEAERAARWVETECHSYADRPGVTEDQAEDAVVLGDVLAGGLRAGEHLKSSGGP